jgi:hypothetical protein
LFGLVMLFRPLIGGLAVVWWLGAYSVVFGALMTVVGFRLRRFARALEDEGNHLPHLPEDGLHQPT